MSDCLIKTENLKTHFSISSGLFRKTSEYLRAVDGVDITLNKGEIVAIVGESGCGKSTLGNSLLGLVRPTSGSLFLNGEQIDIHNSSSWNLHRRNFQMIFQDPISSLNPRHTVFEIISEPLLVHKICTKKEARDRTAMLLKKVGLSPDYMNRYTHSFSGGQKQRICIARIIGLNPQAIICDEITAALDLSVQAQIIELLLDLKKEFGLSLLFISHDLSLVRSISQRIYVMYLGKIVEEAPSKEIFSNPSHPYTRALLDSIPVLEYRKRPAVLPGEIPSPVNPPSGCAFHTRCPLATEKCLNVPPLFQKRESGNGSVFCHFPLS